MSKILTEEQAFKTSKSFKDKGFKIVLVGGCFDLLHTGHIRFLKTAKKYGILFVLLESDHTVKKLKGKNRPLNSQAERAEILSSISFVDYVVKLKGIKSNDDYDKLVLQIEPDLIVITKGDAAKAYKEKQAKLINARVVETMERIKDKSSSNLGKLINEI